MNIRTSVSIPTSLKKRMDATDVPVNWSRVAALAFEQKLSEISSKAKLNDMQQVIERLRASRMKSDDQLYTNGVKSGRIWATRYAELVELEKLNEIWNGGDDWQEDKHSRSSASRILEAMNPNKYEADVPLQCEFWSQHGESDYPKYEYVRGFCDGALEVYNSVKDKL